MAAPTNETASGLIDNVDALQARMKEMRKAQETFASYTQERVDKIFFAAAMAANKARIPLAKMAVEEKPRDLNEFCKKIAATARLRRGDGREDDITVLCCRLVSGG